MNKKSWPSWHIVHSGCYATDPLATIHFSFITLVSVMLSLFMFVYLNIAIYSATIEKLSSSSRVTLLTASTMCIFIYFLFFARWWCVCCGEDVAPFTPVPKFHVSTTLWRSFVLVDTHGHSLSCLKSRIRCCFLNCGTAEVVVYVSLSHFCLLAYFWQHSLKGVWHALAPERFCNISFAFLLIVLIWL